MKKSVSIKVGLMLTTMIYNLFTYNYRKAPKTFEQVWEKKEMEAVKVYNNISRKNITCDVLGNAHKPNCNIQTFCTFF